MSTVNKVILVANLGADPEVKMLDNGACIAKLRVATSETYKNKQGEKKTNTEWHSVVFWNKPAETLQTYAKKGMKLYIEGKLSTRQWDDKDGNKRYTTEVQGFAFQFLNSKQTEPANDLPPDNEPDDLPF